jgi:hypothetical protein
MSKPLSLGLAAVCWMPSLLGAQAQKESLVLSLQGLRTGYCVRFLMEPRSAARELKSGFRLIPANQDRNLHTALQRLVQQQAEFGSWSPSKVCFYFSDAVQIGTRRITERRAHQMLAVWTLATQEERGGGRRDLALGMFSARSIARRAVESGGVRIHEANASVVDSAEGATDLYQVKLERTSLIWRGRPTRDSTRVQAPIEESWAAPQARGPALWSVSFSYRPVWTRLLVGSLTVEGKGDLAKALKASPIRFVGPLYSAGSGELKFSR